MLALRLNNKANKKPSRARLAPTGDSDRRHSAFAAVFVGWGALEEVARMAASYIGRSLRPHGGILR